MTVPDSGVRDEHGMEPIDNLFSSPAKSDDEHQQQQDDAPSEDDGGGEEAMDITTSAVPPCKIRNTPLKEEPCGRLTHHPFCYSIWHRPGRAAKRPWE